MAWVTCSTEELTNTVLNSGWIEVAVGFFFFWYSDREGFQEKGRSSQPKQVKLNHLSTSTWLRLGYYLMLSMFFPRQEK